MYNSTTDDSLNPEPVYTMTPKSVEKAYKQKHLVSHATENHFIYFDALGLETEQERKRTCFSVELMSKVGSVELSTTTGMNMNIRK